MSRTAKAAVLTPMVVLLLGAGAVGFELHDRSQRRDVPIPPDDASPVQVVRTYVAAVDAHDRATARALVVPSMRQDFEAWLDNVDGLTDLTIPGTATEKRSEYGEPAPGRGDIVDVGVGFHVRRYWDHSSTFNLGGDEVWGYGLARAGPHGAWRIFNEGVG